MRAMPRRHAAPATLASLAVILGLAVILTLAARSPAAFPGKNGRIAFASTPKLADESKFEIYTMRPDGSDVSRLTNNAAFDAGPTFSPDGKRIAFVSHRDGNYEIYLMNADGTHQHRLTHNPAQDRQPAFSPDGKRIAFASDHTGNFEIYVMNVNGSHQNRLTHRGSVDDDPVFSPNGKKVAFVRATKGGRGSRIVVMRADGSHRHALAMPPHRFNEFPDWGPSP